MYMRVSSTEVTCRVFNSCARCASGQNATSSRLAGRWSARRRARTEGTFDAIELGTRHERAVVQRRREVRIDVDRAHLGVARQVLIDAVDQLLRAVRR